MRSTSAAKGQTTSLEFFIVSGIVAAIVVASFMVYDLTANRATDAHNRIEMELLANDVMDGLVKTNGIPGGWEDFQQGASSFGLADSPGVIDQRKLSAFASFDYASSKRIMGIENFQYQFFVRTLNGSALVKSGAAPSNPKIVVNPRQTAVLNGTVVYVDFLLWR